MKTGQTVVEQGATPRKVAAPNSFSIRVTRSARRSVTLLSPKPMKIYFKHIKWVNAALMYFVIVFGAGFALGTIRTLWIVPKVGVRTAELMEMPFMVAVTILACRLVVRYFTLSYIWQRLAMGLSSLSLLIGAELFLNFWVTGRPVSAYISDRDPVSGTAYFCALGLFAAMPLLVGKRRSPAGT